MEVRPRDTNTYQGLVEAVARYERRAGPLPGIDHAASRETLLLQFVDSLHRVRYPSAIRQRKLSPQVADPDSVAFNPIKAAVVNDRTGDLDEACWLVFLFVHFGKHSRGGWRYLREVYAGQGIGKRWTWDATRDDPVAFRNWLRTNAAYVGRKSAPGGFGNHRKYESLDADKPNGTAAVVESYVQWVAPPRTHRELFTEHITAADGDPRLAFARLYSSMKGVRRFGRTARFDYLAMLGKLDLAKIIPDKGYLREATGPARGARLLFGGSVSAPISHDELEALLQELDYELGVGMQVLEDALCNWQKRPKSYLAFRG